MSAATAIDAKPCGFRVTIERRNRQSGQIEAHTFPSKTQNRAIAQKAAQYKHGFLRLVKCEPLSHEEWAHEFGPRAAKKGGARREERRCAVSLVFDQVTVALTRMTCGECHVVFAVPTSLYEKRLADKELWWCPNGHCRHFIGKTDAQLLREEQVRTAGLRTDLNSVIRERDHHWIERKKITTRLRHLRVRVKNGVCPCCHRTFKQLVAHIASKHPGFAKEEDPASQISRPVSRS